MSTKHTGSRLGIIILSLLAAAGLIIGLIGIFLAVTWVTIVGLVGAALLGLLVLPWIIAARRG